MKEMCKRLRIPGVYEVYERIADEANGDGIGYEEYLIRVLEAEVESREKHNQIKRIKRAGFPTPKRIEELDVKVLPGDAQERFEEVKSLEFVEERRNVIMVGNSGTGKTHLSIALGMKACERGYTVLFKTAAGLINELKEAKGERELTRYAKVFRRYDLVIVDELGYISFDVEGAELLFQYLALRYEQKSTMITTNLPFSRWINIFKDRALTMALLDRLTHRAIVLNMNGKSYRRRNMEN